MNLTKGKNILCIYYYFPPIKGIGTLRNAKFYSSIKKNARKVFVMTTSNRKFMPHDAFDIREKNIIDLPTTDFRTIHHNIFGSKGSLLPDKKESSLRSFIIDILNKSPLQTLLGEGGLRFIKAGIKRGEKLIEEEGIDMIVSSFRPTASHIIARQLKKKYPHITWVADYRDVTPDPMRRPTPLLNTFTTKVHKRILKYADAVTTVSAGLKEKLEYYHPNVRIIRNGYERSLINKNSESSNSFFTIAYTGIVYQESQDAQLFFRALRALIDENLIDLRDIQFNHAGKDTHYWKELLHKYNLSEILVDHGLIPREEAVDIQRNAHMNILLSWASEGLKGIVTGKIYEYLAARRPIVAIVNGIKDCEIEKMVSGSRSGEVFYNDRNFLNLKRYIIKVYRKWKSGNALFNSDALINQYTWENQFHRWNERSTEKTVPQELKAV